MKNFKSSDKRHGIFPCAPITRFKDIAAMGVTVTQLTPAERDAFVKATRPVYAKWKPTVGNDLVAKAEQAIAARKK